MKKAIRIHPQDTVAVALQPLSAGETITLDDLSIQMLTNIPAGHKFALRDIAEGEDVTKYDSPIGHAIRSIQKGEFVDHHNIATNLETRPTPSPLLDGRGEAGAMKSNEKESLPLRGDLEGSLSFLGFPRPDGQVGIRNDIWVIPTVGCVNGTCRQIVEKAKGTLFPSPHQGEHLASLDSYIPDYPHSDRSNQEVHIFYFPHNYGCSQLGEDHENTRAILRDMILHPNAGGILVVGLGCENNQPRELERLLGDYDHTRIRFLISQEIEGDEVEEGVQIVKELYAQARHDQRVQTPLSQLRVGLKCGGSDGFSGITANPLLGVFSDWLCDLQGGTTVLTEVPEMFGAEAILMRRATTTETRAKIIHLIEDFKQYFRSHGQPVGENPSPGNKAGGISTLEEKALGCTQKAGTSLVRGVLKYGEQLPPTASSTEEQVSSHGLFLLSAPGNDLVASTALAAAGCQLVLFTTGRGTPFSTFVPTLKVSTNNDLAHRKPQWIDFNAGVLLDDVSMDELLQQFIDLIIRVASGKQQTAAERNGNAEFAIFKNGVTL